MKNSIYKQSEEKILMEKIAKSELISMRQLREIKQQYYEYVPYHNFIHALKVAECVLLLPKKNFNIIEIKSLFIAALFHDAGHQGIAEDLDEFRSLDIAFRAIIDFEETYNYAGIDYSIVRKSIIGTVFKNRAKNSNSYAILMADLDVATIGMPFLDFLYYADFPISEEFHKDIKAWKEDVNYFKFLMNCDKNIFRSPDAKILFPHALENIKKYIHIDTEKFKKLYQYYSSGDMSHQEFKRFAQKLDFL